MTETTTWYNQQIAALTPGTVLNGKYELIRQKTFNVQSVLWCPVLVENCFRSVRPASVLF